MPQAIPAVVAAISYVGSAASAVVAGTATLAQIATVAAVGIGAGVGGIAATKALTPQISSQGAAVTWEANPDAPLHFAFGRVGVKGKIIDAAIYGPDRMYVSFACTVSAAGPIKRFVNFRAGDYYMTFNGSGQATNEPYAGEMWLSTRLGAQPDTALSLPSGLKNGAAFPGWNSTRKLSGSACYMVTLGENSKRSAYESKVPAFVTVIEGLYCYDPRLDDTYPGGEGDCRLDDPDTWVWTENPIIFGLKWALGLWEGPVGKGAPQVDYQVGGIGAKIDGIHLASFVEAANVADANGWKGAAWPSTDDDKAQVLDAFMQAGGAKYAEIAGKIACIHRAAARAPVFTVTGRDTAGPIEIDTASSKLNRINTIRPRYWAEDQEWEMTALPDVTSTEWQEEDGQGVAVKRTRGVDYTFVPLPKQARELASLEISNSREGIKGRVPLRPYMDPEPGNTFIFDEPDFALSDVKCIVLEVDDDTENDTVIVTFETETDGKYPYAYGQTDSPPPPQELDPYDPTYVIPPEAVDWTIAPRPPSTGGGQLPSFDLSGVVSNDTATSVLVEFYEVPDGADPNDTPPVDTGWQSAGVWPPTATRIPITVQPDRYYWIGVKYIRGSNYSDRTVWGPYLAGQLLAGLDPEAVLNLPAFQELQDQSRQLMEQQLKAANDRVTASLKELEDRRAQVRDLLIRQGLIAETDPVNGAAILREDVLIQGQGGKTVAQTLTLLYAADNLAQAMIVEEASARAEGDEAEAEARIAAIAAVESALATSALALQAYTDGKVSEATAGLASTAAVSSAISAASLSLQAYADSAVATGTAGLATVSQVAAAQAAAAVDAQTRVNAYSAAAELLFATQTALDGVNSSALIALSTAQDAVTKLNEARVRIIAEAEGGQPALAQFYSAAGALSSILLSADQIGFLAGTERRPLMTIGGDGVVINTNLVVTESLVNAAITAGLATYTASTLTISGTGETTVQTLVFTTTGNEVEVSANFYANFWHSGGGGFDMTLRIRRNGVEIDELTTGGIGGDFINGWQTPSITDNPPAGTHTYTVTVQLSTNSGFSTRTVQRRRLSAREFKR